MNLTLTDRRKMAQRDMWVTRKILVVVSRKRVCSYRLFEAALEAHKSAIRTYARLLGVAHGL